MKLKLSTIAISTLLLGISTAHAEVSTVLISSPVGSSGQDRAVLRLWNDSTATKPVFVIPQMVRRSTGAAWPDLSNLSSTCNGFPDLQGRYTVPPGHYCDYYVQVDSSDDIVGRVAVTAADSASLKFLKGSVEVRNYHTTINRGELY